MYFLRTAPLVRALSRGEVSAEERAKYMLASCLAFNLIFYSGLAVSYAVPWTLPAMLEAATVMLINVVGVVSTFDASGGKDNPDYVAEYICLYLPVGVTSYLIVWALYWAVRWGFGAGLLALSQSHFQFAMNLAAIGSDMLGFVTFLANVGAPAITYLRLRNLLRRVWAEKQGA